MPHAGLPGLLQPEPVSPGKVTADPAAAGPRGLLNQGERVTGSPVHRMLQVRTLEWVPFPSPGDLPRPGIELRSSEFQTHSLPSELQGKCPTFN